MNIKRKLLKLIGHRFDSRFTWGELSSNWKYPQIGLEYCPAGLFECNVLIIKPIFFALFLHLPTKVRGDGCMRDREPAYGFYTIDQSIVWRWNQFYASWRIPFITFNFEKKEILDFDRNVVWEETEVSRKKDKLESQDWTKAYKIEEAAAESVSQVFDYTYVLKRGEVQKRKATVHVDRLTWGRKWARWLKMVRTSINISFDEEVGERTGSWKGGTTGCSWVLKSYETPEQALRRMERERKF